MAMGTRSLPTDSPVPYFQPIERGHMSEGELSDRNSPRAICAGGVQMSPHNGIIPSGIINYPPVAAEPDIYTGLQDDYDTLFEPRHGRGALDPAPVISREVVSISSGGITPAPSSTRIIVNPMAEVRSTNGSLYPNQREHVPVDTDCSERRQQVVSPSSGDIISEGPTIFMDMTETVLDTLDQQVVLSSKAQKPESPLMDNALTAGQTRSHRTSNTRDSYPDLYLPVVENYGISNKFYGHSDSLSTDNNPMVLVELNGLSYQYGSSIYAVDRVNGTMYSKFEVGYKMISERAAVRP